MRASSGSDYGMRYLSPVARLLLAFIFITAGLSKVSGWYETSLYMVSKGMRGIPFFLTAAIVIELVCGVALLIGYRVRAAALILFAYLIPVSLVFHDFWSFNGMEAQNQLIHFMKNVAIMGGLLTTVVHGAGAYSLDARHVSHDRDRDDVIDEDDVIRKAG
ncbi:MAG: DoxX family protein [Deltaproteobacteria bacterium]|nr:DoxX family protein [Deltaproteobacteria bacterium]